MQVRPILAALRHHRLTVALIVLEIALAFAVLCNACFVVAGELHVMNVKSGIDEPSLAVLSLDNFDRNRIGDVNARVLAGLRRIAGLTSVDLIDGLPFVDAGGAPLSPHRGGELRGYIADFYFGDRAAAQALGLRLLAGRMPQDADLTPADADNQRALISRSLAQRLWPDQDPMGKLAWCCEGTGSFRVIGVVQHLVHAEPSDSTSADWSIFVPAQAGSMKSGEYLLHASPRNIERVLREARAAMATLAPRATIDDAHTGTLEDLRARYFQSSRATAGMLMGTIAALLLVTALGIVGLTGYWVQLRRKQIGIRRAVGATRRDILYYFQTENFLIVTFGIVLGVLLAIGLNLLLMKHYEVMRLPYWYLPAGAAVLWLLGQLAVLAPALRASNVPPVVATRSV